MIHKMILMSRDFARIHRVVAAKRKAGVAQVDERIFRTEEDGAPIASAGYMDEPVERLAEID